MLLLGLEEQIAVSECSGRVMNRARADDNEKAMLGVLAIDNRYGLIATLDDCLF